MYLQRKDNKQVYLPQVLQMLISAYVEKLKN